MNDERKKELIEKRLKNKWFRARDSKERRARAQKKARQEWTAIALTIIIGIALIIFSMISTYCYAFGIWDVSQIWW